MYVESSTLHEWGAADTLARKLKDRKKRALLARRNFSTGRFVPKPVPVHVNVFETKSGVLAYRKFLPSSGGVTLAWVSILGERA